MTPIKFACAVVCLLFLSFNALGADEETETREPNAEVKPAATAAPEPSPTPTAAATTPIDNEETYGKKEGLLGPVTVGPKLTLFGLPTLFRAGIEAKYLNTWGLSIDYGFIPKISVDKVSVKMNGVAVVGKWYPWQRAFYLGLGLATQTITATATDKVNGTDQTATLELKNALIVPQFGWRWVGSSGFFMGMELGVQVPVSTKSTVSSTADALSQQDPEYKKIEADVKDKADKLGDTPLPYFALLQLGFFF